MRKKSSAAALALGVVYSQLAGERYIRNLQVTSLESLENGMGYLVEV